MKPALAVIGGFLGAGKTTLILAAARHLRERGMRVAAVLNDQAGDLVDTSLVRRHGIPADQVAGGCFCCRFPDLIDALDRLDPHTPDVIFAEAVGSCADIAATTVRPLLREYSHRFRIAPLTVLVHERPGDPDLDFLFDQQIAEADIVIRRNQPVGPWLDHLLACGAAGAKPLALDYARYAQAEAALVWMNARVIVHPEPGLSPAMIAGPLMDGIDAALTAVGIRIVHLKILAQSDTGYVKAALTANGATPGVEGTLDASPSGEHEVLLNVRALGDPLVLRGIVEREFAALPGRRELLQVDAFRPAAPVPYFKA